MKFDSVILDVDGTIWDTTDIVAQAWNCAIDKMFPVVPHVTGNILKGQFGKTMKTIADNLFVGLEQEEKAMLMEECCRQEQLALVIIRSDTVDQPLFFETLQKRSQGPGIQMYPLA